MFYLCSRQRNRSGTVLGSCIVALVRTAALCVFCLILPACNRDLQQSSNDNNEGEFNAIVAEEVPARSYNHGDFVVTTKKAPVTSGSRKLGELSKGRTFRVERVSDDEVLGRFVLNVMSESVANGWVPTDAVEPATVVDRDAPEGWVAVRSPEGDFQVAFPREPSFNAETQGYLARMGTAEFSFARWYFPSYVSEITRSRSGVTFLLEKLMRDVLQLAPGHSYEKSRIIELGGWPGREVEYSYFVDRRRRAATTRLTEVDNCVYVATVTTPRRLELTVERTFFDSVELPSLPPSDRSRLSALTQVTPIPRQYDVIDLGLHAWAQAGRPAPMLSLNPFGQPGGLRFENIPKALGRSGVVVGASKVDGRAAATTWEGTSGRWMTVDELESCAFDVNQTGHVVGFRTEGRRRVACVWTGSGVRVLPTRREASSCAFAIDNQGAIAGITSSSSGRTRPWLWKNGELVSLPSPSEGEVEIVGMDDNGMVVGNVNDRKPLLWKDGQRIELPGVSSDVIRISGVSSNGRILFWRIGRGDALTTTFVWFRYSTREIPRLDRFDVICGNSCNDSGITVGHCVQSFGRRSTAFISNGAETQDLNQLASMPSGWQLLKATAVNDAGQILGHALVDGKLRACLLRPR